ncbi:MAG: glycoside hydrolase family 38 N-terminal domain-containing protein [Pirellulaceae bacterium]
MNPSAFAKTSISRSGRNGGWSRRDFCGTCLAASAGLLQPGVANALQSTGQLRRRWTVFVIQHSHIDVGYTEKQEIIADQHAQFLRQAVQMALAPEQQQRDGSSRFKFTCEGFWQVEQFLAHATPAEQQDFIRALREGVMELTAGRFHFTELPDQDLLRRSLRPAVHFANQHDIPLLAAVQCDINGLSWGMADALAEIGVRWLSMNINNYHGGYPFGRPLVPFFWEAPSGKRLLAWCGMAYHKANLFGLMGGQTPDGDPGVQGFTLPGSNTWIDVQDIAFAERKLLPFLQWLETTEYPYDFLPLMGSGLYTDNSPPGQQYCGIIQQWNAQHAEQVHVRTATVAEFFQHLEKNAPDLPVHRGEWTDWWSEGVAATPHDTLLFRNAQRNRHLIDLLDTDDKVVSAERRASIDDKLMLYAEHTFGYSHTSLSTLLTHQVFMRKTKHAVDADVLASQSLYEILRTRGEGMFTDRRPFEYTVLNPLPVPVRSVAYLPLDSWEWPTVQAGFRAVDDRGKSYARQLDDSPRGWTVAVALELAAGEQRTLRLVPPGEQPYSESPAGDGFENEFYQAAWTNDRGLTRLTDRATGSQVLDAGKGALGSPVYQLFPGGNRNAAGTIFPPRTKPRDEISLGQCTAVRRVATGPVYERWEFQYETPGASSYALIATFFRDLPHIELIARLLKTDVRDPEGMYVLFPFSLTDGIWHLDKPGAPVRPGIDQLPQSCCDYYLVQHGAALVGQGCGVAWTTLDAPLVQIGKLRLWDYSTSIEPTGPLYSWLTNNKWDTNFRISCGGAYDFRFLLQFGAEFADAGSAIAQLRISSYPPLVMRS